MRKLFTSVMAALCMAAPLSTLSAQQTQLTEAQKEAFKKEVLPVVFEQIKEQAGIDILGWANPQLSNTFAGIPVLESSSLRAAATDPMTVHPDSIVIDGTELVNLLPISDALKPVITGVIGETLKITFEDYSTKKLPIAFGTHPITVDLPATISINNGALASIYFDSTTDAGHLLDVDVDMSLFGSDKSDLVSCSLLLDATATLNAQLTIEDGLTTIWNTIGQLAPLPALPETDYLVTVGLAGLQTGSVRADLYAIPHNLSGARVPAGTAVVAINTKNTFPIEKIDVISYEANAPKDTTLFNLNMSVSNQQYTLTVDKSAIAQQDTTLAKRTIIGMSGEGATVIWGGVQSLINSVVTRAVNELANEGEATWFEMSVDTIAATDGKIAADAESSPVVDITVSPYTAGTEAIADVDITTYKDGEAAATYTVRATADLTSKVITVDVINGETTYGTAYFTSNAADIITANEEIAEEAAAIRIIPTDNGVRVLNAERADYQIVSMTGSTVARGVVSGDETISTANLPKGIYVIAVDQNGDREVVKFVR